MLELDILTLGARGDGLATHEGLSVFVPYTVPGDRVLARLEGRRGDGWLAQPLEILAAGEGRRAPPCPYFGRCGGCALQHLADEPYLRWKERLLEGVTAKLGADAGVLGPIRRVAPGSRRRATFAFARQAKGVSLGFNARSSHDIVDIAQCLLLLPWFSELFPPLRALLTAVCPEGTRGDVSLTGTETGIDMLVEAESRLDLFDRQRLAAFAEDHDLARLSWRRPGAGAIEPLAERRPPMVRFSGFTVGLPPAAFLQPSLEGEAVLTALVADAIGAGSPVADLFAGLGTFSFALAGKGAVRAFEGDAAAVGAAARAAHGTGVRFEKRDLAQTPLRPDELKQFRSVVADPPRAGCGPQAENLASPGGPSRLVMVSCNPATLARDLRLLVDGGYQLQSLTPVDQFPWTAHLEAVAVLER
ncbi:MAG TPA: class I SAM-dependent RNA methyltransferase [Rhodospirillaceae bacterium]|nr:class I SAM-dependent RNA methyltransferase [Rhodospirillaceae bacterium]